MLGHHELIRESVLDAVKGLSKEQLHYKPENGGWSIMEITEHMYLMEINIVGIMMHVMQSGEEIEDTNAPIQRSVDRSYKVEAPDQMAPKGEWESYDDISSHLFASRGALQQFLETVDQDLLSKRGFPHPVFGLMSLRQWVEFISYHEERHLNQLDEVLDELGVE